MFPGAPADVSVARGCRWRVRECFHVTQVPRFHTASMFRGVTGHILLVSDAASVGKQAGIKQVVKFVMDVLTGNYQMF